MPIPDNITREHVFRAMLKIEFEGVPATRGPRKWAIDYEGRIYPCKLLISWANLYANNVELDPNPKNFTTYMAKDFLSAKGFIPIQYN